MGSFFVPDWAKQFAVFVLLTLHVSLWGEFYYDVLF